MHSLQPCQLRNDPFLYPLWTCVEGPPLKFHSKVQEGFLGSAGCRCLRMLACMPNCAVHNSLREHRMPYVPYKLTHQNSFRDAGVYEMDFRSHEDCKACTYALIKADYQFAEHPSDTNNFQLRNTLSRSRCGSHWLSCATRFTHLNQLQHDPRCPACIYKFAECRDQEETEHNFIHERQAYDHSRVNQRLQP